ncbi:MAG: UvrD-helicase domain-containing protein, partial [Longimicrobiales bacterium]
MTELSTTVAMAEGLPRELVLASAGTGKTYTLSGRIISLLAAGAPPDTLLASTFTRKAAGEILNRVLARLAEAGLSTEAAGALARETMTPGIHPPPRAEPEFFLDLLRSLVRDLHRLNIGTLDSFFMRVARGFSPDLGLPPGWFITDEPGAQGLEAEALQSILADSSREETVELIRMAMRGDWGRGVHSKLLAQLRSLRELLHQLETTGSGGLWGLTPWATSSVSPEERQELASRLARGPVPVNKAGKPDGRFLRALDSAVEALLKADWEAFCSRGLASKLLQGENVFSGREIPPALEAVVRDGLELAKRDLGQDLSKQAGALERLTGSFDHTLSGLQRARGAFRFNDITFLLGGSDPVGSRPDIWYRLDQQARHLLLDEFQDTALPQWEALLPLASELLSGHREERSATVVADPKQSIYGWRGADPLLVHRVGSTFAFRRRTLELSYRSSEPVLRLVNQVFMDLSENPVWGGSEERRHQAGIWARGFTSHRAAREIPGYVRILAGPREENMARSARPLMMAWAAERVAEMVAEAPATAVGVLVRQNAAVSRLIMELRARGVEASEEGATSLEDSPAVSAVLALLRLADHPGDTLAAYQVGHSPLGRLFPGQREEAGRWAVQVADRVRRSLLCRGYGATLTGWVRDMGAAGALSHRDLQRLL